MNNKIYSVAFKYALSENVAGLLIIAGVDAGNNPKSISFSLEQNYPNPFNPSTTILYSMAERSKVSISVYNQLGQKVTELFNGEKPGGTHSLQWNAGSLASGVYFYELKMNNSRVVKKLMLVK